MISPLQAHKQGQPMTAITYQNVTLMLADLPGLQKPIKDVGSRKPGVVNWHLPLPLFNIRYIRQPSLIRGLHSFIDPARSWVSPGDRSFQADLM
ncbi:hypothetical protein VULLAG_LOCUS9205 [Vulpes lagopus]